MSTAKRAIEREWLLEDFEDAMHWLEQLYLGGELTDWEEQFFQSMYERNKAGQEFSEKMLAKIRELRERYDHQISWYQSNE